MEPFRKIAGPAASLMQPNIDTDMIIRIERFATLPPSQLAPWAFEVLRYDSDGQENPNFVFNRPPFRHSPILISGRNFGCGSSREGAVWALKGIGVRVIIAESFGDIFFSNCFQNGLLPISLDAAEINRLAAECADGSKIEVDLEANLIISPKGERISFTIDDQRREALLQGLDDIGLTNKCAHSIDSWQQDDRQQRPWIWSTAQSAGT
jgi:3-isopropylmalate/(R)-2-methylmalate dehydratase small subunit